VDVHETVFVCSDCFSIFFRRTVARSGHIFPLGLLSQSRTPQHRNASLCFFIVAKKARGAKQTSNTKDTNNNANRRYNNNNNNNAATQNPAISRTQQHDNSLHRQRRATAQHQTPTQQHCNSTNAPTHRRTDTTPHFLVTTERRHGNVATGVVVAPSTLLNAEPI